MTFTEHGDHQEVYYFLLTNHPVADILANSSRGLLNLADFVYLCHIESEKGTLERIHWECRHRHIYTAFMNYTHIRRQISQHPYKYCANDGRHGVEFKPCLL